MHLRILSPLIIFVLITINASSYGITAGPQTYQHIQVFSQMQIHNSQGQLKAYLEPTIVKFGDPVIIKHYLDSKPKNIITKYGQKFEQIQFEEKGIFTKHYVMSDYILGMGGNWSMIIINDGYLVQPRDSYDAWFTILVPAG